MIVIKEVVRELNYEVVIDGIRFTKEQVVVHHGSPGADPGRFNDFSIATTSREANRQLLSQRFSDIPNNVWKVVVHLDDESFDDDESEQAIIMHEVSIINRPEKDRSEIEWSVIIDPNEWKGDWSIGEFVSEFERTVEENRSTDVQFTSDDYRDVTAGFNILFYVTNRETVIGEMISECDRVVNELFEATEKSLTEKLEGDSVVVHFDFPPEVKVACEQYLLYFIQFLEDLGVEAKAELYHEAGEVLFSVTPADKDEALDNIRAALNTYLHLAASPVNSASVLSTDIEVQRLSANIQHLQGQLTLAHAVLQAKDATIQFQQTTIAQQRQMLTGEIVLESMKDVTPKPKDSEEVLGGLAEITKYEGKGFNLNLPEAFRRLRKMFGEKKNGKK